MKQNLNIRQRTPGHYSSLLAGNDSQLTMGKLAVPGNNGFMKRYLWNSLEPTFGVYNFAEVTSDLAYCALHGLKLIVMIVDKSFSGGSSAAASVMPKGLEMFEDINHGGTSTDPKSPQYGGKTALRWLPQVVAAMNGLTAALGAAFNTNEAFEGVATVETSTSMDMAVMLKHGYTPELYRDSYLNILPTAAANMPNSQVFWFQNYLPGGQQYLAAIADAVRKVGVSLAGPDAWPNNAGLVAAAYPTYEAFKGRMNMGIQFSKPGYSQVHADGSYMTIAEMLTYCRETLYSDYIFWMPISNPVGQGYGWATDAVPLIAANRVVNF